jgi:hypothetical protein
VGSQTGQHRDSRPVGDPTLWKGSGRKQLRQAADGSYPWRIPMGGRACLDRRRAHYIYYRASISGGDTHAVPR